MKRILFLTKYSRKGASSRMRSFQYFPFLESGGYTIEVSPLFDDLYLDNLYRGKPNRFNIVKYYLKRLFFLLKLKKDDHIVIEYELFPYLPAWAEWLLNISGKKYIVDYDDAVFHNYDLSGSKIVRWFLSRKIDKVMKYSNAVVAGNAYIRARAELAGAKTIYTVPTVIDLAKYDIKTVFNSEKFVIGWIGSPSTYKYIKKVEPILRTFSEIGNVEIRIIGASPIESKDGNFYYIPWDENTETELIRKFDVGIMPLDDTPWSRGKCAFKLIQYMASGVPVIANPVGMNDEVVTSLNGFKVETGKDWLYALEQLYQNMALRRNLGAKGREIVEYEYCVQKSYRKWIEILRNDL